MQLVLLKIPPILVEHNWFQVIFKMHLLSFVQDGMSLSCKFTHWQCCVTMLPGTRINLRKYMKCAKSVLNSSCGLRIRIGGELDGTFFITAELYKTLPFADPCFLNNLKTSNKQLYFLFWFAYDIMFGYLRYHIRYYHHVLVSRVLLCTIFGISK